MIQAGTISTGSGCTMSVVGLYWINSIKWVRSTTFPGVAASTSPSGKSGCGPDVLLAPFASPSQTLCIPRNRLSPPVSRARASTSGFRCGKFGGAAASSA